MVMQILFKDNRDRRERKHTVAYFYFVHLLIQSIVAHAIHPDHHTHKHTHTNIAKS